VGVVFWGSGIKAVLQTFSFLTALTHYRKLNRHYQQVNANNAKYQQTYFLMYPFLRLNKKIEVNFFNL
jgi:hypothetical protein